MALALQTNSQAAQPIAAASSQGIIVGSNATTVAPATNATGIRITTIQPPVIPPVINNHANRNNGIAQPSAANHNNSASVNSTEMMPVIRQLGPPPPRKPLDDQQQAANNKQPGNTNPNNEAKPATGIAGGVTFLKQEKLGVFQMWRALIRPPNRIQYSPSQLGPTSFIVDNKTIARREDFQVRNSRGMLLECSYFEARAVTNKVHPCVLYLHGNSSSRIEGIVLIQYLIPYGISLVLMDFAGCGVSEGEYISLGHYEQQDARQVMQHVKQWKPISEFGIWGRSMGAATTLMTSLLCEDEQLKVRYIVADSSFISIKQLCYEIAGSQYKIPSVIFSLVFSYIQKKIRKTAHFDLSDCDALSAVKRAKNKPNALFLVAVGDTLIAPSHSQMLYDSYKGKKRLLRFEGTHNSRRPKEINQEITQYFFNGFFDEWAMKNLQPFKMIEVLPPFTKEVAAAGKQPVGTVPNSASATQQQQVQPDPSKAQGLSFNKILSTQSPVPPGGGGSSVAGNNATAKAPVMSNSRPGVTLSTQIRPKVERVESEEAQPEDDNDDNESHTAGGKIPEKVDEKQSTQKPLSVDQSQNEANRQLTGNQESSESVQNNNNHNIQNNIPASSVFTEGNDFQDSVGGLPIGQLQDNNSSPTHPKSHQYESSQFASNMPSRQLQQNGIQLMQSTISQNANDSILHTRPNVKEHVLTTRDARIDEDTLFASSKADRNEFEQNQIGLSGFFIPPDPLTAGSQRGLQIHSVQGEIGGGEIPNNNNNNAGAHPLSARVVMSIERIPSIQDTPAKQLKNNSGIKLTPIKQNMLVAADKKPQNNNQNNHHIISHAQSDPYALTSNGVMKDVKEVQF